MENSNKDGINNPENNRQGRQLLETLTQRRYSKINVDFTKDMSGLTVKTFSLFSLFYLYIYLYLFIFIYIYLYLFIFIYIYLYLFYIYLYLFIFTGEACLSG